MAERKTIVGGNWKMNTNRAEASDLAGAVSEGFTNGDQADVFVCPPFPYLIPVAERLSANNGNLVQLGAQNFYHEPNGAFTGEVSLAMLQDLGVSTVLTGHSERRHVIGETDVLINEKTLAALEAGLQVVLCIGETLEQREAGKTNFVNAAQLSYGLAGVTAEQMADVVIAYEPVWAIGTGKTATPEDAQKAHQFIREVLTHGMFNETVGQSVRIQYGGSMKPANAKELLSQPDIDGGLIGGAALKADDFLAIVNAG
ncbi:triose-phosphate isomerase [Phycisphaerales bacterium AB-hyl4]|uniref:Triosephosphate isomerase n=1 Tax=Natronomicrosphaera hydrolytica TaxID=3242702 RepID=A0ABV4U3W6_9BACT